MTASNNKIGTPQISRGQRREKKLIDESLRKIASAFIVFRAKHEDKEGPEVAAKYLDAEYAWRKVVNKKWRYHKVDIHALDETIRKNINITGIKPKSNLNELHI